MDSADAQIGRLPSTGAADPRGLDPREVLDSILIPTLGRRESSKRRTRFTIRVAALELFRQHGFSNVTIEQIAARAEVSPRTFFNYFSAKEDCVVFPYELLAPAFRAFLRAQPATRRPLSVVGDAVATLFEHLAAYPGITEAVRTGGALMLVESALQSANRNQLGLWEQVAQEVLEERGESRLAAQILAAAAVGANRVTLVEWATSKDEEPLHVALRKGFSHLESALPTEHTATGRLDGLPPEQPDSSSA